MKVGDKIGMRKIGRVEVLVVFRVRNTKYGRVYSASRPGDDPIIRGYEAFDDRWLRDNPGAWMKID